MLEFLEKLSDTQEQLLRKILSITVKDGGEGSGNWGHKGIEGVWGGSKPTKNKRKSKNDNGLKRKDKKTETKHYREIRNKVFNMLKTKGDCTATLKGKEITFESGYQVSFQTTASEDKSNPLYVSDNEYDKIVRKLIKETGSEPYVGVYGEPEISFRCEILKQAMDVAKKYNQATVWDWKESKCIENPFWDKTTNKTKGSENS